MAGTAESTVNAGESNGCEAPRESWTTTRIIVSVELNPLGVHGTIWGFVGPAAKDLMAWLAPPPNEYETLTWTGSPSGSVTPFPWYSMRNPCGCRSSLVIVTSTWSPCTARRIGPGRASPPDVNDHPSALT